MSTERTPRTVSIPPGGSTEARNFDQAVDDWKRIRSSIEFENTLINHRQTWHASIQLVLATAFVVVFSSVLKDGSPAGRQPESGYSVPATLALIVIPMMGILVSSFIHSAIDAASKQIKNLESWWFDHYSNGNQVDYLTWHPHINGIFEQRYYKTFNTSFIPALFFVGWFSALVAATASIAGPVLGPWQTVVEKTVGLFNGIVTLIMMVVMLVNLWKQQRARSVP